MRTLAILTVAVLVCATPAFAKSGVRLAPDDLSILVSKDLGGQRWAISLNLGTENPFAVTGNVFQGEGEPGFIYCQLIDFSGTTDDIANAQFTWSCFGNSRCEVDNCPGWDFIGNVSLPGSFFLP
jgi:hypothetical protein